MSSVHEKCEKGDARSSPKVSRLARRSFSSVFSAMATMARMTEGGTGRSASGRERSRRTRRRACSFSTSNLWSLESEL